MTTTTLIDRERARLADWLDDLPDDVWEADSWCTRWTVTEVVGHLTFPWRVPTLRLLGQMIRHRGFEEAAAHGAAGLAQIGRAGLVREIRDHVGDHRRPPGAKDEDLLAEVVLHPLDIAGPNGLTWSPDPEGVAVMLPYIATTRNGSHYHPPGGIGGVRFVADDLDWRHGDGPEVTGSARDLLLAISGRPVMQPLAGPGLATFSVRQA